MDSRDLNRHMESIFNTMNDGLIVIAPDGTILMVNQAFERLTGYSSAEVTGQPCTLLDCDACELAIRSQEDKIWWCALFHPDYGGMKRCRCNYRRKDGVRIPVLKNASVLRDSQGVPLGAVETLTDISEIDRLDKEVVQLSRQLDSLDGFYGIIGVSPAMQLIFDVIHKAALSEAPVIIYGESGTGKELVAQAIHRAGPRKEGPFVQVNCAALNESLLESELFGHAKGAFTGAYRHRIGRFEAANGGDIFLDEIGDIPLSTQVKLLRTLETKSFERVGDNLPVNVDVRVITATNQDLERMISQGNFREDLFYRINVIPIHLPPLRQRLEDIPVLVNHFVARLHEKTGKDIVGLSGECLDLFLQYGWPGNVRELKGVLEYAFVIAEAGSITPQHLPPKLSGGRLSPQIEAAPPPPKQEGGGLSEREALVEALRRSRGNQTKAAALLGVNRVTVYNRMRKYGIELKRVLDMD
jgi:two-component system response regulator HydG